MTLDREIGQPALADFDQFINGVHGLSKEERLMAGFLFIVDPRRYNGAFWELCLVGQIAVMLRVGHPYRIGRSPALVSEWSGVEHVQVWKIFDTSTDPRLKRNYRAAIENAALILNVDLDRVLPIFNGRDNYTLSKPAGD